MNKISDKNIRLRYNILNVVIYIVGIVLLLQLFNLQIVHGSEYRETSNTRLTREAVLKAARGDITDSSGVKLVTTKTGFSLELYKTKIDDKELNNMILKMAEILEENKDEVIDNLPIDINPYKFTMESEEEQKEWKQEYDLDENANAEECFNALKEKYKIQSENIEDIRKIMVVRYEIDRNGYSNIRPIIVAKDISRESSIQIEEQGHLLPGTAIVTEPIVTYPYGTLASHILGYLGLISAEEYAEKSDEYDINDVIGRDGIQYMFEKYLKGQDGIRQIDMSVDGEVTGEYISKEAVEGCDVVLTIDANLQKAVESALEEGMKKIQSGYYGDKHDADAGAAIVMNVKTGEVLALASNPVYEPELYIEGISQKKLEEYEKNGSTFNRTISGTYAPGSIYKMVVATAALETGTIDTKTEIYDSGVYPYAHQPVCWYWSTYRTGHGYQNLTEAIKHSCNYFFYEIGYRMGVDTFAKYAEYYGLNKKTGIELPSESTGLIASTKVAEEMGEVWQPGNTLSAAIGQSDNNFTPIEIARYISMLANGGKAVDVSIVKSIIDPDGNEISESEIEEYVNGMLGNPDTELEDLNIKQENLDAILEGMKGVTSEPGGTAYYIFSDFGMDIAGKTGSAETQIDGKVNGWFAGFAPYDDPEIAVVVLIEDAGSGGNTAEVAKTIMQEYFGMNAKKVTEDTTAIPSTEIIR